MPATLAAVIPNFPFFFCVWRSWSHYQGTSVPVCLPTHTTHRCRSLFRAAYKASEYLEGFLQQGAIAPETSAALDAIYAKYASASEKPPPPPSEHAAAASENAPKSPSPEDSASSPSTQLLLTKEAVPELQAALGLPGDSTFAADVYRALEQARLRLEGVAKGGGKA